MREIQWRESKQSVPVHRKRQPYSTSQWEKENEVSICSLRGCNTSIARKTGEGISHVCDPLEDVGTTAKRSDRN